LPPSFKRVWTERQIGNSARAVLRLYQNGSNTQYSQLTYHPAGSPVATNATWTLPASSFFATALSGPGVSSTITVSNLTLSGISGALTILKPIQQTSLQASSGLSAATQTVTQSQDIVFRADSTGSWQLNGFITLNGIGFAGGPTGNQLELALTAQASPEPASAVLMGAGLGALLLVQRRRGRPKRNGING
jgi:hypothetical protein